MKQKHTAFNKAIDFAHVSIEQVSVMTTTEEVLCWVFEKWIMLPVRHNFLNLYRYGDSRYSEKSIRNQFSRKINFSDWFDLAFGSLKHKDRTTVNLK